MRHTRSAKIFKETARAYKANYKALPRLAHAVMLERDWQMAADFMNDWLGKKIR